MRNDSRQPCLFCDPPDEKVVERTADFILIRRRSGLLLAPRQHMARWRDLTSAEQMALIAQVAPAQDRLARGRAVSPVTFIEDGEHLHLRIDTPIETDQFMLGLPHRDPLISGSDDALQTHLLPWIDRARTIDLSVSFLMRSGAQLVLPHLRDLLERGGRLRLLTGDYLHVTEPAALRLIADLEGDKHMHVFQAREISFHPKAWMFGFADEAGGLIVGSSNLSRFALERGVEWNLRHFGRREAAPLQTAISAFETLLERPEVVPITQDWIDDYEREYERIKLQRNSPPAMVIDLPPEPVESPPKPHDVQAAALTALNETRKRGYRAGLVVLATGLGKTYLAAFDSEHAQQVLFVAHREEILTQAMAAFRAVRPKARLGRFTGEKKDADAEVLFASIQTLARKANLGRFESDAFNYIVIDEFHHAAAATYRRIIDHFNPGFLLGLTATPDRTDGQDLLGLCEENLVYQCDLWSGIDRKLLSPFEYFGVPDLVEYSQIPWRNGRFDENALTEAVATKARAENALQQLLRHGGKKCLGFCVSVRHADYMAKFAREQGWRAVAVHSGENSAPRASALKMLENGQLDIVFAVDMFNEGVDIPSIDTVLMLRPTESLVIWLQQLGRGLRKSKEKTRLSVIDYIGNHRIFLTRLRALLQAGPSERALRKALDALRAKQITFPVNCGVTYDLEALEILESLLHRPSPDEELADYYMDFKKRHGFRPTASETQRAGLNPRSKKHVSWLNFVASMGDLSAVEHTVWTAHKDLLNDIETTHMTKSYKMLVLRAIIEAEAFPGRIALSSLTERVARLARRNPHIKSDLSTDPDDTASLRSKLIEFPIKLLSKTEWFRLDMDQGIVEIIADDDGDGTLATLASEIIDWRILRYLQKNTNR